jgi:hypothetical protein
VPEIAHMYKSDRAKYEATSRNWTQKYAMGWDYAGPALFVACAWQIMDHLGTGYIAWQGITTYSLTFKMYG